MKLSPEELNTIQGLLNYLNSSFDGHGLVAYIELDDANPPHIIGRGESKGFIKIAPEGSEIYVWDSGVE